MRTVKHKLQEVPRWFKIWALVLLVIIAGLFIWRAVAWIRNPGPELAARKVGSQVVKDIQRNNAGDMYDLASPSFKQTTSQDSLQSTLDQISPQLQGKTRLETINLLGPTDDPEVAVLVYMVNIADSDDGPKYIRVTLQKLDNGWQIVNFRSSDTKLDADTLE